MDEIQLTVPGGSSLISIEDRLPEIGHSLPGRNIVFLTDENLFNLYPELFDGHPALVIPAGEQEKSHDRAQELYRELVKIRADRATWLVAVGGGVITDLGGFVATTFLRGMKLAMIPTSLLAMVDAAIGGKNGINLGSYKNLIGTFRQPEKIIVFHGFLDTLPDEEFKSGLAEVIKYGLIHDPTILDLLENCEPGYLKTEIELIQKLIARSIRSKVEIVEQDFDDQGIRRILNFGHTFGHAVERTFNLKHGFAVALGMCVAMQYSVRKKILAPEISDMACRMIQKFGLIPGISPKTEEILEVMGMDKKVREGKWTYILLRQPGSPEVVNIDPDEYARFLDNLKTEAFYEQLFS